jgi:hypothetical protein
MGKINEQFVKDVTAEEIAAATGIATPELTYTATEAAAIITQWFQETFYNKALDTEFFNYNQAARDDLLKRFQRGN